MHRPLALIFASFTITTAGALASVPPGHQYLISAKVLENGKESSSLSIVALEGMTAEISASDVEEDPRTGRSTPHVTHRMTVVARELSSEDIELDLQYMDDAKDRKTSLNTREIVQNGSHRELNLPGTTATLRIQVQRQ